MAKTLVFHIVSLLVAMLLVALWCEHRARRISSRAVSEQEQRDLEFWRKRLVPVYRELGIKHDDRPTTKAELFDPLIMTMDPILK